MSTGPTAVTHGQTLPCPLGSGHLHPSGNGVICSKVLEVLSLEKLVSNKGVAPDVTEP